MTDFKFLKEVEEKDGGVNIKRLFHASSYQGGVLLRTTTIMGKTIASSMINLPMGEIYQKEDGSSDIRMVTFNLHQIGMDIGFDLTDPTDPLAIRDDDYYEKGPPNLSSECKE